MQDEVRGVVDTLCSAPPPRFPPGAIGRSLDRPAPGAQIHLEHSGCIARGPAGILKVQRGDGGIHRVSNPFDEPAVSQDVYSPPDRSCIACDLERARGAGEKSEANGEEDRRGSFSLGCSAEAGCLSGGLPPGRCVQAPRLRERISFQPTNQHQPDSILTGSRVGNLRSSHPPCASCSSSSLALPLRCWSSEGSVVRQ